MIRNPQRCRKDAEELAFWQNAGCCSAYRITKRIAPALNLDRWRRRFMMSARTPSQGAMHQGAMHQGAMQRCEGKMGPDKNRAAARRKSVSTYCYNCVAGPDPMMVTVEDGIAITV